MKKLGNFFAVLGLIGLVAMVAITIRFGVYNMRQAKAENEAWRMNYMDRR